MKKICISLIAALNILPISLSANNAHWDTDKIYVYEKPYETKNRTKLTNYKKFDSYQIIACDNNGWCLSEDGYVKKFVLRLNKNVPIVRDLASKRNKEKLSKLPEVVEIINQNDKVINNNLEKEVEEIKTNNIIKDTNLKIDPKSQNIINLSIENLIKEVVKRNPSIIFDKIQGNILDEQITYEDGIFTPQFYANLTHQDSNTPNNTETTLSKGYLSTYTETTNNIQIGMSGLLPSGAKWNTSLKSNDRQSNVIDKYKEYDTEYDDSIEISFSQPILKGYGSDITKSKYHLVKADKEIYLKQYRKRLMDVMGSVIQTYWKFYAAKQLQISWEKSLEINQTTIKLLEQRVESGDVAYSEVLEAKSASMVREAELKSMRIEVIKIRNEILTLLNVSSNDNKEITFNLIDIPNTNASNTPVKNIAIDDYYKMALKNWPELAIAKEKLKKEKLQIELTKDLARPQLDLVSSASSTTLDDKRQNQFYDADFISWSVGLQFSMPVMSGQSQSAIGIAKLKKKQVELEINTLDKGLYNALSTKLESLNSSKEQVQSYENGLKLKEELYEYVQKGFKLGEKSIRDILVQEEDIINYKRRLFNSIINWKLSEASLDKASGVLFNKYLSYEDIERLNDMKIDKILNKETFGRI